MFPMKPSVKWRIVGTISFGVVLRIAWVAMVSPIQKSDYANYLFIARNIVQNHMVVEDGGKRSYSAWRTCVSRRWFRNIPETTRGRRWSLILFVT